MKTTLTLIALALASSVVAARSVDSVNSSTRGDRGADFKVVITGDGPDIRYFAPSQRTRAEVIAERAAARHLPSYVDGFDYDQAMQMFMSRLTREQVLADLERARRAGDLEGRSVLSRTGGQ